ncbi:unnamed protein product, partial [marine sediment metagenome]
KKNNQIIINVEDALLFGKYLYETKLLSQIYKIFS